MKYRMLLVLLGLLAASPSLAAVPLDEAGFTAYMQQKLQLYSPKPVTVYAPYKVAIALPSGATAIFAFPDVHDRCVKDPAGCDQAVHDYIQGTVRQSDLFAEASGVAPPPLPAINEQSLMSELAVRAAGRNPAWTFDISRLTLSVTRPHGRAIELDQQGLIDACRRTPARCSGMIDDYLAGMQQFLSLPAPAQMRAVPIYVPSCDVIASVGNSMSCRVRPSGAPLAPFFRPAFPNIGDMCLKIVPEGGVLAMTTADRHDLDLSIGEAVDLCDKSTRDALGPLDAKLNAEPAAGTITGPFAASHVLFPADWSAFIQAHGGHLIVAMPSRDTLLYRLGDGEADIAALGARAREAFMTSFASAVSIDVYRWNGDGWSLATSRSAMVGGPPISVDAMPRVH